MQNLCNTARVCLEQCATNELSPQKVSTDIRHASGPGHHHLNVLVTSGSLIPSLVKCLLFRLDGLIACENG